MTRQHWLSTRHHRRQSSSSSRSQQHSPTPEDSYGRPAYTLSACVRCRSLKSRCDPTLPRCNRCAKGLHRCQYDDPSTGKRRDREEIVKLQDQVRRLEAALAKLDVRDDAEPDEEELVRDAAVVEFRESAERKFLGPSSGTTMTRLVMRLAKEVSDVKSIHSIVSPERLTQIESRQAEDHKKATSKLGPDFALFSAYAATKEFPEPLVAEGLLSLFNIKVQSMYPLIHEPSLPKIFKSVHAGSEDPYENFVARMIVAISLQRADKKWVALGDSYYLGALSYFEHVVRQMNLQTLQCFVLIGEYSLLTPTRTASFFIVGMGVRLAQALGIDDEKTLVRNSDGSPASALEKDLKRRAYWAIVTMDYGLAHSLGRPSMIATSEDRRNVEWFAEHEDEYITDDCILPLAPISTRKWIAIHFYQMRLLQLEIRRTLYLQKRPMPASDSDPWFEHMHQKLLRWMNRTPPNDHGSGYGSEWFRGRYYTMVVFLFRPSPQVPRPSAGSAIRCFEACYEMIALQYDEMESRSVELTWAFTQTLFMNVNTILWALSYGQVRDLYSREDVNNRLNVAFKAIDIASERWPGAAPALQLYEVLTQAVLPVYRREGDVNVEPSRFVHSDQMSSVGDSTSRYCTQSPDIGPTPSSASPRSPPINRFAQSQAPNRPRHSSSVRSAPSPPQALKLGSLATTLGSSPSSQFISTADNGSEAPPDGSPPYNAALPTNFAGLGEWSFMPNIGITSTPMNVPVESTTFDPLSHTMVSGVPFGYFPRPNLSQLPPDPAETEGQQQQQWRHSGFEDPINWNYPDDVQTQHKGLNEAQHGELMHAFETEGLDDVHHMVQATSALFGYNR